MTIDDGGSTGLGQVHSLELRTEDATGPGLPQVRIRAGGGPRSRAWPPHRAAPVDRRLHMVAPAAVPLRRSSQDCAARSAAPPHASGAWCPDGVILFVLLWIVTIQVLWLVWAADVLAAWVARGTESAADARAVEFGYGPTLVEAYAKLGGPEQRKGRLARLVDFHPPMPERVARVRASMSGLGYPGPGERPDHPHGDGDHQDRPERVVRDEEEVRDSAQ